MKDFPLSQEYNLPIIIQKKFLFIKWNKTINITYKQATVLEYLQFLDETEKDPIHYILAFLKRHKKFNKNDFVKLTWSIDDIWKKLQKSYLKWYFDKKSKKSNKKVKKKDANFNSTLVILSRELKSDPLYLLENYTIEQINYLSEGIEYLYDEDKARTSRRKQRERELAKLDEEQKQRIHDFIHSND